MAEANALHAAAPYLVAIGTTIVTGFFTYVAAWMQHRGKPENALIDQLQEQIAADREAKEKEMEALSNRIAGLEQEQRSSKRRERIRDDYINRLRRHIQEGNPPPPPEWPADLYE